MEESTDTSLENEIYFLMAKCLQGGKFPDVGQVLVKSLEQEKKLPKRLDWKGDEHDVTFDELDTNFSHVESDLLLRAVLNVGGNVDEGGRLNNVEGIRSLLQSAGCGRLDPLRSGEGSRKARWGTKQLLYSRHPVAPRVVPVAVGADSAFPKISQLLISRRIHGQLNPEVFHSKAYYSGFELYKRVLGHLAAAFSVCFDKTGKYILTGSDDRLLKLWNVADGRLLHTFRGHSAEVVIMAINDENTMLAAVATDRTLRIWSLETGAQIIVHKCHQPQSFVSSLKFSPSMRGNLRYLVAASMDGTVNVWKYDQTTMRFLSDEVIINERNAETPHTKICSLSFSAGGTFMATGDSEGCVRIYNLLADSGPVKTCSKNLHLDRVDSIEYCHVGDRVLTGSRDGTGRIWLYRRQEWTTIMLNSAHSTSVAGSERHDPRAYKRRVTMVGWSRDDHYALLASDDNLIRVFDSYDGRMIFELAGHQDSVYVLESHPFDTNIYLTAGHDARLIIWSLLDGSMLCRFEQWINGHGPSPYVDAKWSPDGTCIAATDMFGTLNIYGHGAVKCYDRTPNEQFFHTDYRPLMRDHNGFVVDEQTQLAPYLMQPPFLVDAAGVPYGTFFQKLVPGRKDAEEQVQPAEPLPALDAANQALSNQAVLPAAGQGRAADPPVGIQYDHPADPYGRTYIPKPLDERICQSTLKKRVELALLEVDRYKEQKALKADPNVKSKEVNLIAVPLPRLLEGEDLPRPENAVDGNHPGMLPPQNQNPVIPEEDDSEDEDFQIPEGRVDNSSEDSETELSELASVASVEARERHNENEPGTSQGTRRSARKRKISTSDSEKENSVMDEDRAVFDGPSTSRGPPRKPPPKKTIIRPKPGESRSVKKVSNDQRGGNRNGKRRKSLKVKIKLDKNHTNGDGPRLSFPKWLTDTVPKPTPYFPQIDDIVYYFLEEHKKYVTECHNLRICSSLMKNLPYSPHRNLDIQEVETLQVRNVTFKLCREVRVAELDVERLSPVVAAHPKRFKLWFHEIADVADFLVLKQTVDDHCATAWQVGDRVRSLFNEEYGAKWFKGIIQAVTDNSAFVPGLCKLRIRWDPSSDDVPKDEQDEDLPCYEVYPITQEQDEACVDGAEVTEAEILELAYVPAAEDWDGEPAVVTHRILRLLGLVQELGEAELFTTPVDLELYPFYPSAVVYPVDLHTITQRLEKGFYRRKEALLFDFKQIPVNSDMFNESLSEISRNAHVIADICCQIVSDMTIDANIRTVYNQSKKKWIAAFEERKKAENNKKNGVLSNSLTGNALDAAFSSEPEDDAEADDHGSDTDFSLKPEDEEPSDDEADNHRIPVVPEEHSASSQDDAEDDGSDYGRTSRPQRKKLRPLRNRKREPSGAQRTRKHGTVSYREKSDSDVSDEEGSSATASRRKASQSARRQANLARISGRMNQSGPLRNGVSSRGRTRAASTLLALSRPRPGQPTGSTPRSRPQPGVYREVDEFVDSPASFASSGTSGPTVVSRTGRVVRHPDRYE